MAGRIYESQLKLIIMKQIDFKNFKQYNDISHETTTVVDIRQGFADLLYKNVNGVAAHDLAFRIYRTEEPIVLNEEEEKIILQLAENGLPIFMDSLKDNLVTTDETSE
jgi:GGDEF domain-containing protein